MVNFATFAVEQWMDKYETSAKYNIAETCCDSITLQHLQSLSCPSTSPSTTTTTTTIATTPTHPTISSIPFPPTTKLTYGHIRGSPQLRQNICSLYNTPTSTPLSPSDVLITPGAIAANFLLFYSLVGKGDHVICVYPTYQALYAVAESLGAEVDLWKMDVDTGENPSLDELRRLIRKSDADGNGGTKLIVINNPNNPTGSVMPLEYLQSLVTIASSSSPIPIPILSDEVYRPIFSPTTSPPPSILTIYPQGGISTGSMSKAFSLAGIRLGWIATHLPHVIETCAKARDYTTISVSRLDDAIATLALSPATVGRIIERNLELVRTNASMLRDYVTSIFPAGSARYTEPQGGTTAFIQFFDPITGEAVDDVNFCEELIEKEKMLIMPGSLCFGHGKDFKGYVRIGYCCATEELREGMDVLAGYLRTKWRVEEVAA